MKKVICIAALSMIVSFITIGFSEEKSVDPKKNDNPPETLWGDKDMNLSGYGAPYYSFSKAGNKYGNFAGLRGGLIMNNNFVIGAKMSGLLYPRKKEDITGDNYTGTNPYMHMMYGGGLLEYYLFPKRLINVSIGTLIGGGRVMDNMMNGNNSYNSYRTDGFFALEPEVNLFLNVTRFMRIGIGGSYRYVQGINSSKVTDKDFKGPAGSLILAFGWF